MPCCFYALRPPGNIPLKRPAVIRESCRPEIPKTKLKKYQHLLLTSANIYVITYIEQMKQIRNSAYNRNGAVFRWIGSENGGMMYVDAEYFWREFIG